MVAKPWVIVAWNQYYPMESLSNVKESFETEAEADRAAGYYRANYDFCDVVNIVEYVNERL